MFRSTLAALALALPPAAAAQPRPDVQRGLVAWYRLAGDATDAVTRARAGAVGTRPVPGYDGAPGGALHFDGARSAVNLGSSLDPGRFTISAWIRPDAVDRPEAIVSKIRNLPGHWTKNFELRLDPGGRLFLQVPNGASWEGVAGNRTIQPGRWTHVAAVYDGAVAQLYVDGAREGAPLRSAYQQTTADVFIGARPEGGGFDGRTPSGPTYFFAGAIGDVRIWDRPLGDVEVALVARAPGAPQPPQYAEPAPPAYGPPPYGPPPPQGPPHHVFPPPPAERPVLVVHLPLDGDAHDAVGNGDGALVGVRPAEDRFGNQRSALGFAGKGHVALGIRTEPEQFTLAAWILPARIGKEQPVFSKRSPVPGARDRYLELALDSFGRLSLALPNDAGFAGRISSPRPLAAGRWVHVAASFDGGTGVLYVDGERAGEGRLDPFEAQPGMVFLGARPDPAGKRSRFVQPFVGSIDDLRVYRGALAPQEVAVLARREPEGPPDRGGGRGDDDEDVLLVRVDALLARYDAACARGEGDRLEKVEAHVVKVLEEAERGFRGDRGVAERMRRAIAEFRRSGVETDAMSLDRKRSALFDLSEVLWNDLAQEFEEGPARPRHR